MAQPIYPTQLIIRRNKEKKEDHSEDRLTLDFVENMAKGFNPGTIYLRDENNDIVGRAEVRFLGFCDYYMQDDTHAGSSAMYRMSLNLNTTADVGKVLHADNDVVVIYNEPRGNAVDGERPVVNGLKNPEVTVDDYSANVDTYVVTANNGKVGYNRSGAHWGPGSNGRLLEIFDSGISRSVGLVERVTVSGKQRWRSLKRSVTVNFVMIG